MESGLAVCVTSVFGFYEVSMYDSKERNEGAENYSGGEENSKLENML